MYMNHHNHDHDGETRTYNNDNIVMLQKIKNLLSCATFLMINMVCEKCFVLPTLQALIRKNIWSLKKILIATIISKISQT